MKTNDIVGRIDTVLEADTCWCVYYKVDDDKAADWTRYDYGLETPKAAKSSEGRFRASHPGQIMYTRIVQLPLATAYSRNAMRMSTEELDGFSEKKRMKESNDDEEAPIVTDARYSKGMKAVQCPSKDGWKTRAGRLAEILSNGRYSNREHAYIMSPTKAAKLLKYYKEGYTASDVLGTIGAPPEKKVQESHVGKTWDAGPDMEGNVVKARVINTLPDGRLVVQYGNAKFGQIIKPEEVESTIAFDKKNLDYRLKQMTQDKERQAKIDASKAEAEDLDGFDSGMSDMKRGRVLKTLQGLLRMSGEVDSIRNHIRRLVKKNYKVVNRETGRTFQSDDGGFYTEKSLTKTGMDYADYLSKK